ncbi:MAG: ATP-binding protein [Desulfobacteraceae bacterium]|nr:ATP-binding protein [Desulfobacteraceae bacterium]
MVTSNAEDSYGKFGDRNEELVRSERLAFTGRIAASIAHEIRNPLGNVYMAVQQLKKGCAPDSPWVKHIEVITRNTERINFLITELLNCARPPKLNIEPHDIHEVLESVLDAVRTKIVLQHIKVHKELDTELSVINVDNEQIKRVFSNVMINAVESMPENGEMTVVTENDENNFIVKIKDNGHGIPDEDIIRIFDPFFSTKSTGVGLGLSICYGIVVSHGGIIGVESEMNKGTTFTISLPIK